MALNKMLSITKKAIDESTLQRIGKKLAKYGNASLIIYLYGHLGVGKTTFARSFIHGYGYVGLVKSPTYAILEPYQVQQTTLLHLDLYRLSDGEELEYLGLRDYMALPHIMLIEWPENADAELPEADLSITLSHANEKRDITLVAHNMSTNALLLHAFSNETDAAKDT